jgi:hypothetical protein
MEKKERERRGGDGERGNREGERYNDEGDDVKITGEQIILPLEYCNDPTVSLC